MIDVFNVTTTHEFCAFFFLKKEIEHTELIEAVEHAHLTLRLGELLALLQRDRALCGDLRVS